MSKLFSQQNHKDLSNSTKSCTRLATEQPNDSVQLEMKSKSVKQEKSPRNKQIGKSIAENDKWNPNFKNAAACRSKINQHQKFAYDLSKDEQKYFRSRAPKPMKPISSTDLQLLQQGNRLQYLNQRYDQPPNQRYEYPEATSWRIGWLQRQKS